MIDAMIDAIKLTIIIHLLSLSTQIGDYIVTNG